jgi:AcrR family transcriptional regulator
MDAREKLIDAAEALIAKNGVHGFSLREAARAVKLDPAMVYRYFEDRGDLVNAVADRGIVKLAKAMRAAERRAEYHTATDTLRIYGRVYLRFALREASLFRVMFGPERGRTLPGAETPFALLVQCLVQIGAERGVTIDPARAAALCWAGVHGVAMLALDGAFERTQPVQVEQLNEAMLDALLGALPNKSTSR